MIKGLVIGHRDFSRAVMNVLESVSGDIECIDFISNEGLSTDDLTAHIQSLCQSVMQAGILIFVDMYGGSCWRAAKKANLQNTHIVSGFNIPMLLSFIHKRQTLPFDELVRTIGHDGKRAIRSD